MGVIETRRQQMFPVLDAGQIETAKRFAIADSEDSRPARLVGQHLALDATEDDSGDQARDAEDNRVQSSSFRRGFRCCPFDGASTRDCPRDGASRPPRRRAYRHED